jgi:hypothetical protein
MQLVNDRCGFWKAFWKSDGISGKKPEVDDPTLWVGSSTSGIVYTHHAEGRVDPKVDEGQNVFQFWIGFFNVL